MARAKIKLDFVAEGFRWVRFTGAAGATLYTYSGVILRTGDKVFVDPAQGHWAALLESGNAEIVAE